MKKACIIEDETRDLETRYNFLIGQVQDIDIVIDDSNFNHCHESVLEDIIKIGFDIKRVTFGLENIPEADIYFTDGLDGNWNDLFREYELDKDKIFLCSTNPDYISDAKIWEKIKTLDPLRKEKFRREILGMLK